MSRDFGGRTLAEVRVVNIATLIDHVATRGCMKRTYLERLPDCIHELGCSPEKAGLQRAKGNAPSITTESVIVQGGQGRFW